jgi:hypothetical protein
VVDTIVAVFVHDYNQTTEYDLRQIEVAFQSRNFKYAPISLVNETLVYGWKVWSCEVSYEYDISLGICIKLPDLNVLSVSILTELLHSF